MTLALKGHHVMEQGGGSGWTPGTQNIWNQRSGQGGAGRSHTPTVGSAHTEGPRPRMRAARSKWCPRTQSPRPLTNKRPDRHRCAQGNPPGQGVTWGHRSVRSPPSNHWSFPGEHGHIQGRELCAGPSHPAVGDSQWWRLWK